MIEYLIAVNKFPDYVPNHYAELEKYVKPKDHKRSGILSKCPKLEYSPPEEEKRSFRSLKIFISRPSSSSTLASSANRKWWVCIWGLLVVMLGDLFSSMNVQSSGLVVGFECVSRGHSTITQLADGSNTIGARVWQQTYPSGKRGTKQMIEWIIALTWRRVIIIPPGTICPL